MTVKKTAERTRQSKRLDQASENQGRELAREEMPCTHESIYGVRYPKEVIAVSLAKAPVLG